MEKKIFHTLFIISLLILILSHTARAGTVHELVEAPTADMGSEQASLTAEITENRGLMEGIYLLDEKVEVGIQIYSGENNNLKPGALVKFLVLEENEGQPALAVGLRRKDLYLAASKDLGYNIRGHAGIGDGHYGGIFAGINKVINPADITITEEDEGGSPDYLNNLPPVNLMAEYLDQEINLGARFNFYPDLYFDLHLLNFDTPRAGMSYTF